MCIRDRYNGCSIVKGQLAVPAFELLQDVQNNNSESKVICICSGLVTRDLNNHHPRGRPRLSFTPARLIVRAEGTLRDPRSCATDQTNQQNVCCTIYRKVSLQHMPWLSCLLAPVEPEVLIRMTHHIRRYVKYFVFAQ